MGRNKTKNRWPGARCVKDRHGEPRYWYVRPIDSGPEIRLTADYGTTQWEKEYLAARGGAAPIVRKIAKRPGSAADLGFAEALESYMRTIPFKNMSTASQNGHVVILKRIAKAAPHAKLRDLNKETISSMLEDMTPHMHRNIVWAIRTMAKALGLDDPAPGYVFPKLPDSRGFQQWKHDDVEKYRACWPLGTLERTMLELLLWTCQRRSDCLNMKWSDIVSVIGDEGEVFSAIAVASQQKTKASVMIPIDPDLQEALDAWEVSCAARQVELDSNRHPEWPSRSGRAEGDARREADRDYILKGHLLYRLGPSAYGDTLRNALDVAGLKRFRFGEDNVYQGRLSGHGLRKAGMSAIAEGGGNHFQIMAISGHTSTKNVDHYVKEHERLRSAVTAAALRRKVAEKQKRQAPSNVVPLARNKKQPV